MDQDMSKYIDLDGALVRMRGNKPFYRRMLQLFLDSKEFAAFDESIAGQDIARAADIAHGLKGMTGNLSLTMLFELSTKLMDQLRNGVADEETIAQFRDAYQKTYAYVQQVITEL